MPIVLALVFLMFVPVFVWLHRQDRETRDWLEERERQVYGEEEL